MTLRENDLSKSELKCENVDKKYFVDLGVIFGKIQAKTFDLIFKAKKKMK
jgi:hypothetical protein